MQTVELDFKLRLYFANYKHPTKDPCFVLNNENKYTQSFETKCFSVTVSLTKVKNNRNSISSEEKKTWKIHNRKKTFVKVVFFSYNTNVQSC